MLGAVTARDRDLWETVKRTAVDLGHGCSPDDAWLGLRGLRSLAARLDRHEASARRIAAWLEARPEVERVLYPALESDPGHAIFTRDFDRATGVFGLILHETDRDRVASMVEGYEFFKLGYSWGGFQSLLIPLHPERGVRTAATHVNSGTVLRLSIGLEAPEDLIRDLERGFERLARS
jgi:cystathionine beta-lyase